MSVPVLQHGSVVRGVWPIRPSMYLLRGTLHQSHWKSADSSVRNAGVENKGFERLDAAWARGEGYSSAGEFIGPVFHAGWDWGIRAPEADEIPPCWPEIVIFFTHWIA